MLNNASKEQLDEAIVRNYISSHREIAATFDTPSTHDLFGIEGFITGIPYMMMNSLFGADPRMTHADVQQVLDYYRQHHLPLMWFFGPRGQETRVPELLLEMNIEEATMKVPGMVVDLENVDWNLLAKKTEGHELVQVDPKADLEQHSDIFMQAFEVDPAITEPMKKYAQQLAQLPDSTHFFVVQQDQPVATASVVYRDGVAGIYNVATLPSHQRQGLASALMVTMMQEAREQGYQYSILHSSERGKVVYERLGYEVSFWFRRFLLRPKDVGL